MSPNIENLSKTLSNDHKILSALHRLGPMGFTQINNTLDSSPRTISKHLKNLCSNGMIEKRDRVYRITAAGLASLEDIRKQLTDISKLKSPAKSRRLYDCIVTVTAIRPSRHGTLSTLEVSLPRRIELKERHALSRALRQASHIIHAAIPEDTDRYETTITGQ